MTEFKTGAQLAEERMTKVDIIKGAMRDLELRKWCLELAEKSEAYGDYESFIKCADAIYNFATKD